MEKINERVCELIAAKQIKKTQFAKDLGISQPYVSELCKGTKSPSDRTIRDICRLYDVNETWLRTGDGQMFGSKSREFVSGLQKASERIHINSKNLILTNPVERGDLLSMTRGLLDLLAAEEQLTGSISDGSMDILRKQTELIFDAFPLATDGEAEGFAALLLRMTAY